MYRWKIFAPKVDIKQPISRYNEITSGNWHNLFLRSSMEGVLELIVYLILCPFFQSKGKAAKIQK